MVLSPPESLLSYMVLQIIFPFLSCLSLFQPERINPELNQKGYSVKSDIWSLGITMVTYIIIAGYKVLSANPQTGWALGTQKQMLLIPHSSTLSCPRERAVFQG